MENDTIPTKSEPVDFIDELHSKWYRYQIT